MYYAREPKKSYETTPHNSEWNTRRPAQSKNKSCVSEKRLHPTFLGKKDCMQLFLWLENYNKRCINGSLAFTNELQISAYRRVENENRSQYEWKDSLRVQQFLSQPYGSIKSSFFWSWWKKLRVSRRNQFEIGLDLPISSITNFRKSSPFVSVERPIDPWVLEGLISSPNRVSSSIYSPEPQSGE